MARSFVRHTLAAMALLAVAACGNDSTGGTVLRVDITSDKPSYAAGATATMTVRNLGNGPIPYSLCTWQLQRNTSGGWVVADQGDVPCAALFTSLAPGEQAQGSVPLPGSLPAGTYRVYYPAIMQTLRRSDPVSVDMVTRKSSKPFEVTG